MNAVIFGASGQDGQYLSALLREQGCEVIAVSRGDASLKIDITDYKSITGLVRQYKPDYVFHFAANSTTRHDAFFENYATISTGTLNILEAVKEHSSHTKVFISGSGLQFKNNGMPIKESDPFEARDAYSVCRIQSVYTARYFRSVGIKAYVGYLFNHDSPLRTERHMTMRIAAFAKRIANGSKEKLEIGDTTAVKEYAFAGDIVKGIWTLVNQEEVPEANVSSGKGYSIEDWLEQCFSIINKDWKEYVVKIPGYQSPYKQLVSDPARIFSLGWRPEIELHQLAEMMMR